MSQSSQKKTHAMVAQSIENGEEALTYVKVERTRSEGNLEWYRRIDQQRQDSIQCCLPCQSNDGQTYME